MWNRIIFLLTTICFFMRIEAQVPGYINTLNTSGGTGTGSGTTYTYSVGEVVIFNNSCLYTPGAVQPTCICIVPISEVFDKKYNSKFYPNPTSNYLIIETDYPDFVNYSISSVEGKILESGNFGYAPIDLSKFVPGTYMIKLSSSNKQIFKTVKIIKQ